MYAVIRAGGKQYKVQEGDVIEIERVKDSSDSIRFTPLLVVDDEGKTRSGRSNLADARVTAKVVDEVKGPKLDVYKYRNKTGYRRHNGHRQRYTSVEISGISLDGQSKPAASRTKKQSAAADSKPAASRTKKLSAAADSKPAASRTKKQSAAADSKPAASRTKKQTEESRDGT